MSPEYLPKSPPGIPNRGCLVVVVALAGLVGALGVVGRVAWSVLT